MDKYNPKYIARGRNMVLICKSSKYDEILQEVEISYYIATEKNIIQNCKSINKITDCKREKYHLTLQEVEIRYKWKEGDIWFNIARGRNKVLLFAKNLANNFSIKKPCYNFRSDAAQLYWAKTFAKLHHLFYFFKTHFIISARGMSWLNIFV